MIIQRKRVAKRLASGLLAGAMALGGLAISGASPASATSSVTAETRLSGTTRYETAIAVAKASVDAADTTLVLVSGENFPDGLSAAALAGALGAPMLLTDSGSNLPVDVLGAIGTLKVTATGLANVVIVGGTSAVSAGVEAQLTALGYSVSRFSGADRYATADAVAAAVKVNGTIGSFGGYKTAFLANGTNFPDALAASSWAYRNQHPIFLTNGTSLSDGTAAAIKAAGIQQVIVLGGEAAVSSEVQTAVGSVSGVIKTLRVSGDDRYGTATALADAVGAVDADYVTNAILVSGSNFPDALAASQLAGKATSYAIIPVSDPLSASVSAWAAANITTLTKIRAIGGTAAVSADAVTAVKSAATIAPITATIALIDGGQGSIVFSATPLLGALVANSAQNPASYVWTAVTGATKDFSAATLTYTALTKTMAITGVTFVAGDTLTINPSTIRHTTDTTLFVAGTSATVAADTTGATATIRAYSASAAATDKVIVAFDKAVQGFSCTAVTVTAPTIGAAATTPLTAGETTVAGLLYTCDTSAALVVGSTVTIPAGTSSSGTRTTASTPVGLAKTSTSVVTDAVAPTMTSAVYANVKASALAADQASDTITGTGAVKIQARPGTSAAGSAGNGWTLTVADAATASVSLTAATKTITVTVKSDDSSTATEIANLVNSDATISALFVATVTTAGVVEKTSTVSGFSGGLDTFELTVTASEPLQKAGTIANTEFSVSDTVGGGTITVSALTDAMKIGLMTVGSATLKGTTDVAFQTGIDTVEFSATTTDLAGNVQATALSRTAVLIAG